MDFSSVIQLNFKARKYRLMTNPQTAGILWDYLAIKHTLKTTYYMREISTCYVFYSHVVIFKKKPV